MMQEFVEAVKKTIKKEIAEIHTAIPGKIVSYDSSTGLATVLPTMKFKKPDGTMINYPQITGVPVLFQQGAGQGVTMAFPVKAGDGCLIIVAEQSIDYWMYGQETETDLLFDLTNAICIPGLFTKANKVVAEACEDNALILDAESTKIKVSKKSVSITAPTVTVSGNLQVSGNITANGDVSGKGVSLSGHTHSGDGQTPSK